MSSQFSTSKDKASGEINLTISLKGFNKQIIMQLEIFLFRSVKSPLFCLNGFSLNQAVMR